MESLTFVYFSAIDWSFRVQHHFIAREIAKAGGRVLFVENSGVRWPAWRDVRRLSRRARNLVRTLRTGADPVESGIHVITPRVLPIHPSAIVRRFNRASLHRQVRSAVPDLEPSRTVAWIGLPNWTSLDVARALRARLTVYYNADEFARVPGAHPSIRESEAAVIRAADLVFVTSERLQRLTEREGRSPIRVQPLVDVASFADAARGLLERPDDLRALPGRILGYMGGVNHKIDRDLLEMVATAFPHDSVVILGGIEDPRYLPRRVRNIHVFGRRPPEQLPAYLQHFDVCLIPYVRKEFTDSVYPAKLHEYLAAGRPVVATALPEIRRSSEVVRIAESPLDFVEAVREALEAPRDDDLVARRIAVARQSSYEVIVPRVLEHVRARLAEEIAPTAIVT